MIASVTIPPVKQLRWSLDHNHLGSKGIDPIQKCLPWQRRTVLRRRSENARRSSPQNNQFCHINHTIKVNQ